MAVDGTTVLFEDDFASGLDLVDRWQIMAAGPFTADDGVPIASEHGLTVAPPARHPETGEPAFTKDARGHSAHLKWLALTAEPIPLADGETRFEFRAGARCFGASRHPYGDAVADPDTDLRLGAATLNVIDFESGMVFDFWITSRAVYPFYERIALPGSGAQYARFGSLTEPVARTPEAIHDLCIAIDAGAGKARWEVDGKVIASVDRIGPPDPAWSVVLVHGGVPQPARPKRVQLALGLLTLLDASLPPSEEALVDVGTEHVPPRTFRGGPTLFGQGVELRVAGVTVERG